MKKMNRKGFTFIEVIVSLFATTLIIGLIMTLTYNVYSMHKTIEEENTIHTNNILIMESLREDLSKSDKLNIIDENTFSISNSTYSFNETNVVLNKNNHIYPLTEGKYEYEIIIDDRGNETLKIVSEENKTDVRFKINFTHVRKGLGGV